MTVVEKPQDIPTEPVKPTNSGWRYFLLTEIEPLRLSLISLWFWISLGVAIILFVFAFQFPFTKKVDLDAPRDRPLLVDYYAVERYQDFVYRWVQPSSNIILSGVGQVPKVKVVLEVSARPPEYSQPKIEVKVNRLLIGIITPEKNTPPTTFQFEENIPDRALLDWDNGTLNLWLNMEGFLARGDRRPLGVVVSGVTIEAGGLFNTGRPVIPPLPELLMLICALALTFVLVKRVGFGKHSAFVTVIFFAVVLASGIVLDRVTVGLSVALMLQSLLIVYPLAVGGWWFSRGTLKKRTIDFDQRHIRWLVVIFAFAFFIRIVGMNHPSFQVLDHGFRVNEVLEIKQNPGLIFSRYYNRNTFEGVGGGGRSVTAGQWGLQVSIPYTPLFYMMDLPVAWLTLDRNSLLYWTNVFGAWLDVSAIFFLYLIARTTMGRFGQWAGICSAALYCFFPLSYLMVSDGGFNSIVAHWFTLAYLLALTRWFSPEPPKSWSAYAFAGFLLTITFLAHSATLLLVGGMLFIFSLLLYLRAKPKLAGVVALQWVSALVVSFALYYGFYLVALITQTLPAIIGKIGSGEQIGKEFLAAEVRGFFPTVWAHFYFMPFLVTLILFGWLFFRKFSANKETDSINPAAILLYFSWLATFLLFAVAAEAVNLLQKHMLFVIPLFSLGVGLALAMLVDYFKPQPFEKVGVKVWSRPVILAVQGGAIILINFYVAMGTVGWYQRVINYVLPAGTG
jgi:hypothetical protein